MSEETLTPNQNQALVQPSTSSNTVKYILFAVLGLLLLGGAAYGGYWYGAKQAEQTTLAISQPTTKVTPTTTTVVGDETEDWKTYTNPEYGYLLKYPKDWFVNFDSPTNQQFSDIESSSPFDTRARIDINSTSIESFRGKYNAPVGTKSEVAFKVVEEKIANSTIDGEPAVKLTRVSSEGATSPVYVVRILVAKGDSVFEISSWGKSKETQKKYDDTFNQILPTFKFLEIENQAKYWKTYTDTINKIEFQYPPYKAVSSSKLQPYNFLTGVHQDGTSISIANLGGGRIEIYNNPEQLSLEDVFKKRAYLEISTFAEDKAMKIDHVNGVLRYETWSLPDEVITIHFVYNDKYIMATRGFGTSPIEETLQQAEEELVSIMETFKFLD